MLHFTAKSKTIDQCYVQLTFNHAPAADADFSSHVNYSKSRLYNLYSNLNAKSNLHGTWLRYGLWLPLRTVLRTCSAARGYLFPTAGTQQNDN